MLYLRWIVSGRVAGGKQTSSLQAWTLTEALIGLRSGTVPFGANGDVPVNGDFDGDQRADVAIFRPSVGEWWINRSSTGATVAAQFGQNGDKPTPGDFDKDGKTDIAFWRPANGNYFVLRSSNSSFFSFAWGSNGDIPVGAAIVP